jgi:hypothetical protein
VASRSSLIPTGQASVVDPLSAQRLLNAWSTGDPVEPSGRLGAALSSTRPGVEGGMADVAVLLRQVLRSSDEKRRSHPVGQETGDLQLAQVEVPICAAASFRGVPSVWKRDPRQRVSRFASRPVRGARRGSRERTRASTLTLRAECFVVETSR